MAAPPEKAKTYSMSNVPEVNTWVCMAKPSRKDKNRWVNAVPALVTQVISELLPGATTPEVCVNVLAPNVLALRHNFQAGAYREFKKLPLADVRPYAGHDQTELKLQLLRAVNRAKKRKFVEVDMDTTAENIAKLFSMCARADRAQKVPPAEKAETRGDENQAVAPASPPTPPKPMLVDAGTVPEKQILYEGDMEAAPAFRSTDTTAESIANFFKSCARAKRSRGMTHDARERAAPEGVMEADGPVSGSGGAAAENTANPESPQAVGSHRSSGSRPLRRKALAPVSPPTPPKRMLVDADTTPENAAKLLRMCARAERRQDMTRMGVHDAKEQAAPGEGMEAAPARGSRDRDSGAESPASFSGDCNRAECSQEMSQNDVPDSKEQAEGRMEAAASAFGSRDTAAEDNASLRACAGAECTPAEDYPSPADPYEDEAQVVDVEKHEDAAAVAETEVPIAMRRRRRAWQRGLLRNGCEAPLVAGLALDYEMEKDGRRQHQQFAGNTTGTCRTPTQGIARFFKRCARADGMQEGAPADTPQVDQNAVLEQVAPAGNELDGQAAADVEDVQPTTRATAEKAGLCEPGIPPSERRGADEHADCAGRVAATSIARFTELALFVSRAFGKEPGAEGKGILSKQAIAGMMGQAGMSLASAELDDALQRLHAAGVVTLMDELVFLA